MGIKRKDNFKLIITLGPASRKREFLNFCKDHNLLSFRLNCSHLSPSEAESYINFVKKIFSSEPVDFYLDLKGHKQRIGALSAPLTLQPGKRIRILAQEHHDKNVITLPSSEMWDVIEPEDTLLLMDGTVRIQILRKQKDVLTAKVIRGGLLRSDSGIIVKDKVLPEQAILIQESRYLSLAQTQSVRNIALSYVSKPQDLKSIRKYCRDKNYSPLLSAKIERPGALKNLKGIFEAADEIWYCRGDLGLFIPFHQLAIWQEKVIKQSQLKKIPVFIAGQVFQHLTHFPEPTRSESIHFYSLLKMGINGIVLSDETAIGKNPRAAVLAILELLEKYYSEI